MALSQAHRLCLHLLTRGVSRLVGANDGLVGANDGLVRANDGLVGPNNNLISAEFVMSYYKCVNKLWALRKERKNKQQELYAVCCLTLKLKKLVVSPKETMVDKKSMCRLCAIQLFNVNYNNIRHHFCDILTGLHGLPNHRRTIRINWRIK